MSNSASHPTGSHGRHAQKTVNRAHCWGRGGSTQFAQQLESAVTAPPLVRCVVWSQLSSAESLYDPHLEELAIEAEIENTRLIISNIYIPPASSCSNGYQSSIEHLLTTQDSLIHDDFNAHHTSPVLVFRIDRYQRKKNGRLNGSDHGILN